MKLRRYLTAAATQPPAAVLQVSYACGLDVVRDLGRHGVPVLGLDPDPAAIGLRSRYAAGLVCPDPLVDEEALLVWLETLGATLPRRAVVFPSHDEFIWPLSRHAERLEPWFIVPFSRWDVMARVHDKRAQMEAARRAGVDTPKTVFVGSGAELEAAAGEVRFPAVLKPVESLAFKLRFHRHILDVETPADLQRIYDMVDDLGVLMLQERIPGGEDELWTVGSYLDVEVAAAGGLHRPQAAPVPARRRQLPRRRERLGRGTRRRGASAAHGTALPRRQSGGVQARPARRALLPHGGQRPALEVARPGGPLRGQPLVRGLPRRHRRPVHRPPPAGRRQVDRRQQGRAAGAAGDREAASAARPTTCGRCAGRGWTACTHSTTRCRACSTRAARPCRC